MCRDTVKVRDGSVYDCDFNQQLGLNLGGKHTFAYVDVDLHISTDMFINRRIFDRYRQI